MLVIYNWHSSFAFCGFFYNSQSMYHLVKDKPGAWIKLSTQTDLCPQNLPPYKFCNFVTYLQRGWFSHDTFYQGLEVSSMEVCKQADAIILMKKEKFKKNERA